MSEGPGVRQARYQDRRGGCCLSPAVEGGPCSFLASLLPQLRARWLFIRTTGWVGGDLQPPGSLLLPLMNRFSYPCEEPPLPTP